ISVDKRAGVLMIRYRRLTSFTKFTSLGHPFRVWREELLVPRIDDRYLDCSAYLYPTPIDAQRGERAGGTGFLVAIPAATPATWLLKEDCPTADYHHTYVVSNRHVVQKHPVVRLNSHDGRHDVLPFATDNWTFSKEHDLAVVPIDFN